MKHKDLYDILKTLNIPVAYDHFSSDKNIEPPFLAYREIAANTFKADNITYKKENNFELELVTSKKDVALQETIEDLLTENKIPYEVRDEVWDSDEKIYHNYYEI